MDRFNALGRGAQVMLIAGVLLFISLFLPWQDFDFGGVADELGVDATFSGWRGVGVILGILAIALVAWLVVRMAAVDIRIPVSVAMISAALGALILLFGIIKMLTIIDDEATIWAWVGLILAVIVAIGAWLEVQAAGGIDTLKNEMPRSSTATTAGTMTVPPVTTTPEAAPEPYEPPAAEAPEAPPRPTDEPAPTMPPEPTPPDEPEAPYDPDARRDA
jgi:cation transport ATPase